jgi:hypothetical protein
MLNEEEALVAAKTLGFLALYNNSECTKGITRLSGGGQHSTAHAQARARSESAAALTRSSHCCCKHSVIVCNSILCDCFATGAFLFSSTCEVSNAGEAPKQVW